MASFETFTGVLDPMLQTSFAVKVVQIPAGLDTDNLEFKAQTVQIPESTSATVEVMKNGDKVLFAGGDDSPKKIDMTFWETSDLSVYSDLYTWRQLVHNPASGTRLPKSLYSGQVLIELIGTEDEKVGTIYVHNAFPVSLQAVTLNAEAQNEKMIIPVSIAFDWFVFSRS